MKIFGTFYQYDSYLDKRLSAIPRDQIVTFSFLQQWIADDFSVVFQGLFRELANLDGIEASAWTLPNCMAMQDSWASENAFVPDPVRPDKSILMEQLRRFQPDVFIAFGYPLNCSFLETLRRELPNIRLIAAWDGRRFHDPKRFRGASLVFSCLKETVDYYNSQGFQAAYLPYFFDIRVLSRLPDGKVTRRIVFPGSIQISADGHNERLRFQKYLCDIPEFEPYLDLGFLGNWRVWAGMIKRGDFSHIDILIRLARRNRQSVYGLEMLRLLASSLVTANVHIDAAGAFAGNIRLFEATGVGSCLLTDSKQNLKEFFDLDTEIVAYRSFKEAREKARWLLDHPQAAAEFGARSATRVKRDHSAACRAVELLDAIQLAIRS